MWYHPEVLDFQSCGWWLRCLGSFVFEIMTNEFHLVSTMVPLKSLVSDGNHIPSLFVCRSWAHVAEFSFDEDTLSKRAICHRESGFSCLFQQL